MESEPPEQLPVSQQDLILATPEVRLYEGDILISVFALTNSGLSIGKASTNVVIIPAPEVSRFHAQLRGEPGCWLIEDRGSTNGTFVYEDNQLIYSSTLASTPHVLRDGQEIRFGPPPNSWYLLFRDLTTTPKMLPVFLDSIQRRVWVRGRQIRLPRDQYTVLFHLYTHAPNPCSYEALCTAIEVDRQARKKLTYTDLATPNLQSLHHLIHRLRAHLEVDPTHPHLVVQVPHFGYRLHNVPELDLSR